MKLNKLPNVMHYKPLLQLRELHSPFLWWLLYFTYICIPFYSIDADTLTFKNPILREGPEPCVYKQMDGNYYLMVNRGDRLDVWKSTSLSIIVQSTTFTLWKKPIQAKIAVISGR